MNHVLILVEGSSYYKQLKKSKKQLFSLSFCKDTISLAILHEQALSQLITYLNLFEVLWHHFGNIALSNNLFLLQLVKHFHCELVASQFIELDWTYCCLGEIELNKSKGTLLMRKRTLGLLNRSWRKRGASYSWKCWLYLNDPILSVSARPLNR